MALIPKIEGASELSEYRPISMVGSVYKIIYKIMALRLREVLPYLIGETQSTFVAGRQILDGALIANEIISWAKKSNKEAVLLKHDFQKSYDTINWNFIDHILDIMGFRKTWRLWTKSCLSSATVSILENGSPTAPFKMERGL